MSIHDATEVAYKNGYQQAVKDILSSVEDLLVDFDEMEFVPIALCPDPEAYALDWKTQLVNALNGK